MANSAMQPEETTQLTSQEIMQILPHRFPFLLIDKVVKLDLEKACITCKKAVSVNESFFQGHFPGAPIMPGVLILESMAQAGGVLSAILLAGSVDQALAFPYEKITALMSVQSAKFRKPVRPGDLLQLEVEMLKVSARGGKVRAIAKVDDKTVAEAEFGYAGISKEQV